MNGEDRMVRKWTDAWRMNGIKGVGLRTGVGLAKPRERAKTTQARRQSNVMLNVHPQRKAGPGQRRRSAGCT